MGSFLLAKILICLHMPTSVKKDIPTRKNVLCLKKLLDLLALNRVVMLN